MKKSKHNTYKFYLKISDTKDDVLYAIDLNNDFAMFFDNENYKWKKSSLYPTKIENSRNFVLATKNWENSSISISDAIGFLYGEEAYFDFLSKL